MISGKRRPNVGVNYWREHEFTGVRPFFCQIKAVETAIWLAEAAPKASQHTDIGRHIQAANVEANPDLLRVRSSGLEFDADHYRVEADLQPCVIASENFGFSQNRDVREHGAKVAPEFIGQFFNTGYVTLADVSDQFDALGREDSCKGVPAFKRPAALVEGFPAFGAMPSVNEVAARLLLDVDIDGDVQFVHRGEGANKDLRVSDNINIIIDPRVDSLSQSIWRGA